MTAAWQRTLPISAAGHGAADIGGAAGAGHVSGRARATMVAAGTTAADGIADAGGNPRTIGFGPLAGQNFG